MASCLATAPANAADAPLKPYLMAEESTSAFGEKLGAKAIEKVEKGLALSKEVRRISRIDIPGTEQSLFSVAILAGSGSDATVMKATDTGAQRHTAHLPYEFLVSGGKVVMLHGKFRIAQSFPDLTMGTFMNISGAPSAIESAIKGAVR